MKLQSVLLYLSLAVMSALIGQTMASERYITLASTTSTENSGLFGHIVPLFTQKTGIEVRVVAVGTGQAFSIGRRGDADALLVHDTRGEEQFVADGYGVDRRDIMYNDFIIVGPDADPAGVRAAADAEDALRRIAESGSPFASRGDDSGTHRKERALWASADVEPKGGWYRELGSGMGPTLNTAAAMNAYTLADRGTWLSFRNRQTLDLVFEGDEVLFNPYGSIIINPERHDHVKYGLAREWHEWLTSEEGRSAIAGFRVNGMPLFFPVTGSDQPR
ncbi:MAG: substrate-binding domain-containing protein [Thioalkalivibrio sp.]